MTFQPEGVGDLAIFDDEHLVETIQIKSLGSNLTLSDLVSSSHPESSFFHRTVERVREQPDLRVTLISFGPIGREIERALAGDENARTKFSRKLAEKYGVSPTDTAAVLEALVVERVNEDALIQDVFGFLRNAVTGTDPKSAFGLLCHWLYGRAERKSLLTQQDVIERVNGVGRFTAESAASADVWFSSVEPIENQHTGPHVRRNLAAEYYRGPMPVTSTSWQILMFRDRPSLSRSRRLWPSVTSLCSTQRRGKASQRLPTVICAKNSLMHSDSWFDWSRTERMQTRWL